MLFKVSNEQKQSDLKITRIRFEFGILFGFKFQFHSDVFCCINSRSLSVTFSLRWKEKRRKEEKSLTNKFVASIQILVKPGRNCVQTLRQTHFGPPPSSREKILLRVGTGDIGTESETIPSMVFDTTLPLPPRKLLGAAALWSPWPPRSVRGPSACPSRCWAIPWSCSFASILR